MTTRTRRVLSAVAVLLTVLLVAEGWFVFGAADPAPSAERPVVVGAVAEGSAVESAARSTSVILSYGYEGFDAQIADATGLMTASFADEFQASTETARDRFLDQRVTQEVRVVASSVVRATDEEVQALLFVDRYLARAGKGTSVTPYRALVTVVRSDTGWLVSNIETP